VSRALAERRAIRVDLSVPVTRVAMGPFSFDPVEQMIGAKLVDLLEPLMVGPVRTEASPAGAPVDVYPLALPDGEGASIPLGKWGECGFYNDGGLLEITAPWATGPLLRSRLGDALVLGPEAGVGGDGRTRVVRAWVRLSAGLSAAVPAGGLGEVRIAIAQN